MLDEAAMVNPHETGCGQERQTKPSHASIGLGNGEFKDFRKQNRTQPQSSKPTDSDGAHRDRTIMKCPPRGSWWKHESPDFSRGESQDSSKPIFCNFRTLVSWPEVYLGEPWKLKEE